ncbi:MAG: hypothetical protein EHM43_12005 [Ignavibacteriae bacterium]|nr:MAG: hypothetical protein EHM43_12005 [Ignavibacteriota bacterium]
MKARCSRRLNKGTGNREQGTGNWEQGTGNRYPHPRSLTLAAPSHLRERGLFFCTSALSFLATLGMTRPSRSSLRSE